MKVTKEGKVKLERDEIRVGNFFFKLEPEHIKVQDLNSLMTFRVGRRRAIGIWLENTLKLKEDGHETLRVYAATIWTFLCMVPDNEAIKGIVELTKAAIERHPDWYGYKPSDDDKENADAAQEVKEMAEFEESVKTELNKKEE